MPVLSSWVEEKMEKPLKICVLVVAGGSGSRFGASLPKQYYKVQGKTILRHTVDNLSSKNDINAIQVVIHPDHKPHYDTALRGLDLPAPAYGGQSRQESVYKGLQAIAASDMRPDLILIHDAARPFVSHAALDRVIAALKAADITGYKGASTALPIADTLRRGQDLNTTTLAGETVDRTQMWRMQTPQGFIFQDILAAHRSASESGHHHDYTDDVAVAQAAGLQVAFVAGNQENIKITHRDNIMVAEQILSEKRETRMGMGFDVHVFGPNANGDNDNVCLCGVKIPHDTSLKGHSDADVALHALTDALLGAIAAGDIGHHFPPSDPQWKGASSDLFLKHAGKLIKEKGGHIVNVDLTIICERPKIGPHRQTMLENLAKILDLDISRVSIKATTTERLGFTGRGEGIAAQAIATVAVPV